MEFEFDKFITDIEKRNLKEAERKTHSQQVIDQDKARRLRDKNYFERWQNRIVWGEKQ